MNKPSYVAAFLLLFIIVFNSNVTLGNAFLKHRTVEIDTAFKLANIFQSNMVLQQHKPFRIWGKASPANTITLKADWSTKTIKITTDEQGNWKGEIAVPKAVIRDFTPHSLTLTDNGTNVNLSNLLIGEVWLASGQSNMQFSLKGEKGKNNGALNYEEEMAATNLPNIRFFYTDLNFKAQPYNQVTGKWVLCTPETAGHFSAVAYYFSKELYEHLNIPVGIILSTIGASTGQAWTSRKVLESDTILYNKYLRSYDSSPKSKNLVTSGFSFEKVTLPTLLYNAMIHPLAGFSIKGFIWYQGEFNRSDKDLYTRLQTGMIKSWREDFDQGDLPFYLVQMPPYYWGNENTEANDYAYFREAQANIRKLKNTEMAVIIDDDEARNLHPRNKKPVGIRLSKVALNKDYKFKNIPYLGPHFSKMKINGSTVEILFKKSTLAAGLITSDNQPPKEFYIAGSNKIFYEATAAIEGNKIILTSDKVANPIAVRYAFRNIAVTNLTNKAGLPVEPFRTDNWEQDPNMKVIIKS
ncbi:MAG: Sialate O-acetylesterase [Mucilaginibacter sp.]|uniref:sialate O-acetylesterase n=1 Tax=Mucilaginibacter sp. TaxID=1882438 RepID=UPI0026119B97|nr:sialate O-acetylesterase [Mucilaginibacter sp.]MDB5002512.1 Sialate O-acetylesterase [Mucilaginibacter sp.]